MGWNMSALGVTQIRGRESSGGKLDLRSSLIQCGLRRHLRSDLRLAGGLLSAVLFSISASPARAQALDLLPQGLNLGSFRLFPTVPVKVTYDSNIRLLNTPVNDIIASVQPSVALRSSWSSHQLELLASSNLRRYKDNKDQNSNEWQLSGDGRVDVDSSFTISPSLTYARKVEVRGTPGDDARLVGQTRYKQLDGAAAVSKRFNRLSVSGQIGLSKLRYDDILIGGVLTDLSFRNFTQTNGSLRLDYLISDLTNVFVTASANRSDYVANPFGLNRDGKGYTILGGLKLQPTSIISGEVSIGYLAQTFKDPSFKNFKGLNYNINISWKPTALTTVQLGGGRSIVNSALVGVPGILRSNVRLSVTHELLRDLILSPRLEREHEVYRGINRSQNRTSAGISARRIINRALSAVIGYDYQQLDVSGVTNAGYKGSRVTLSIIVAK